MSICCSRGAWNLGPCMLPDRSNHNQKKFIEHSAQQAQKEKIMAKNTQRPKDTTSRRSFLRKGLAVAGAGAMGTGLFAGSLPAFAEVKSGGLDDGGAGNLRVLAAGEILENEPWRPYHGLGGM